MRKFNLTNLDNPSKVIKVIRARDITEAVDKAIHIFRMHAYPRVDVLNDYVTTFTWAETFCVVAEGHTHNA